MPRSRAPSGFFLCEESVLRKVLQLFVELILYGLLIVIGFFAMLAPDVCLSRRKKMIDKESLLKKARELMKEKRLTPASFEAFLETKETKGPYEIWKTVTLDVSREEVRDILERGYDIPAGDCGENRERAEYLLRCYESWAGNIELVRVVPREYGFNCSWHHDSNVFKWAVLEFGLNACPRSVVMRLIAGGLPDDKYNFVIQEDCRWRDYCRSRNNYKNWFQCRFTVTRHSSSGKPELTFSDTGGFYDGRVYPSFPYIFCVLAP